MAEGTSVKIAIDKIVVNPDLIARSSLNDEYLEMLAKSLDEDGLLHPITVRPLSDGRYELIDGLHRLSAAKRLGWKDIEANVIDADDLEARFLSLKANLVRRSLEPVEEGEVVYRIMVKHGLTEKEVAKRLGVTTKWVSERLALVLKVPEEVKKMVAEGKLGLGHAVVISKIEEKEKQLKFARLIVREGWSVKEAERMLPEFLNDTIYTIGYDGRTFEELLSILKENGIVMVLDVRHDVEFVKPEFSIEVLKRQLPANGIKYVHVKELGVPKLIREPYVKGKMSYECFRQWYEWWLEENSEILERALREAKSTGPTALLCQERYPTPKKGQKHYCHRHILAEVALELGIFEKRLDL